MELPTIVELLKEPLELLKKEAEECNEFFKAVSRMREIQRMGMPIFYKLEEEKLQLEKQIDDFLAKRRVEL